MQAAGRLMRPAGVAVAPAPRASVPCRSATAQAASERRRAAGNGAAERTGLRVSGALLLAVAPAWRRRRRAARRGSSLAGGLAHLVAASPPGAGVQTLARPKSWGAEPGRRNEGRRKESEEERLALDKEAREGMEEYMVLIEKLAEEGNVRAQKTAWKWQIRKKVWNHLEDNDIADFPRPVHHRIPNFKGSQEAGQRLTTLPEFKDAKVVKVNPDTPQKSVRVATLRNGKTLYVPQPRLRTGFYSRITPGNIPESKFNFAATPGGMKQFAEPLDLTDRTKIDIVVVGSSAVNPVNGARIGKGEGFAELEYGMLRTMGCVDENTPVICTVHDSQIISENMPPEGKPMMKHDVPVDIIVTPTQVIRVPKETRLPKPTGIYWDLLSREKLKSIRILQKLKALIESETGETLPLAEQEEALPPLAKRGKQHQGQKMKQKGKSQPKAAETQQEAKPEAAPARAESGVKGRLSRPPKAA